MKTASANDELERLDFSPAEVNKWLAEWDVSNEEKTAYLKTLVDVYAKPEPYVRSLVGMA